MLVLDFDETSLDFKCEESLWKFWIVASVCYLEVGARSLDAINESEMHLPFCSYKKDIEVRPTVAIRAILVEGVAAVVKNGGVINW